MFGTRVQRITPNIEETRKIAEKLLRKRYKCLCSYYIEDMSDNVCAFDLGSNSRKPLRLFLQKDGTFSTAAGLSRKKFKTKFFAKLKLRKYKNCILVKHILYHSVKGDFEDFMEELRVID